MARASTQSARSELPFRRRGDAGAPPTVSVVISAYTEARFAQTCDAVRSVQAQLEPATEIVLVADHNDALLERLRSELRDVLVLPNVYRAGLAGARNSGVEATTGEVVAFLDDDALAQPDWISELQRAYGRGEALGVGGHITPRWSNQRPAWFPAEFYWVVGSTYRGIPDAPCEVRNPIGANMSVYRDVFDALGGFRTQMGRRDPRHRDRGHTSAAVDGLEETDFCIRASERFPDRAWLHWPPARVLHAVSAERETWRFFLWRCQGEGVAKAAMVRMTGRRAGLESERRYVRVTLPLGVLRELGAALRGDPGGLRRAGAIIVGLTCTVAGYLIGSARFWRAGRAGDRVPELGATP